MSKVVPLLETLFMNKGGSPELWKAIIKVINSKPEEGKYFASYAKTKMKDINQDTQLLALDLIDFVVAEGKIPLWTQIASKDFLTSLVGILKTRDAPEVQLKILYLIKKWGTKFESYKEILPNFFEFYKNLKSTGAIIFPDDYSAEYPKYLGIDEGSYKSNSNLSPLNAKKSRENNYNEDFYGGDFNQSKKEKRSAGDVYREEEEEYNRKSSNPNSRNYKIDLNPNSYDKKYSKLIGKLSVWFENVILANDMIDNTKVGSSIEDGLKYVIDNLRGAENDLMIYIQEKVRNEKVLEMCLGINDDINKTITRYDVIRSKAKPEPFCSNFEDKNSYNNTKSSKKKSGRVSSRSPIRAEKEKVPNDAFDVFDLNNEINNVNKSNSKKNTSNLSQPVSNLKSVDDIFEIFGGNMATNSQASSMQNNNELNSINNNAKVSDFNFGDSFPVLQNNSNINTGNSGNNNGNFNEPGFNFGANNTNNNNPNSNFADNNQANNNINYNSNFSFSSNQRPGIDSLSEKLKNVYSAKDDVDPNENSVNDKRIVNQNMSSMSNMNNMGMGNMYNYPGQQQYPNMNNMMPGYNMVHPGMNMMGMNMQPQVQPNMMNMGMNQMSQMNQMNQMNQINQMSQMNQMNQMNPQQNRINPGFEQNYQMQMQSNNNNMNKNFNPDPFNF